MSRTPTLEQLSDGITLTTKPGILKDVALGHVRVAINRLGGDYRISHNTPVDSEHLKALTNVKRSLVKLGMPSVSNECVAVASSEEDAAMAFRHVLDSINELKVSHSRARDAHSELEADTTETFHHVLDRLDKLKVSHSGSQDAHSKLETDVAKTFHHVLDRLDDHTGNTSKKLKECEDRLQKHMNDTAAINYVLTTTAPPAAKKQGRRWRIPRIINRINKMADTAMHCHVVDNQVDKPITAPTRL